MRRDRGLIALFALAPACTFATSSTTPTATFGYDHAARVALLSSALPELAAGWRDALRGAGPVEIVASLPLEDAELEPLHERACRAALELARAGTPVDHVVAVIALQTATRDTRCTRWEYDKGVIDRLFDKDDDDDGRYCAESEYESMSATTTARIEVFDAGTCRPLRTEHVDTPRAVGRLGHGEADDEVAARASSTRAAIALAFGVARELYPIGIGIAGVAGRMIEVGGADALAPGAIYVVRGHAPGPPGPLGRVRVVARDGDHATLEAERDFLGVGPGDELRRQTLGHLWTVYAAVTAGALRADADTAATAGVHLAVRWAPHRIPMFVETAVFVERAPALDTNQAGGGLALGARWPSGPIQPYALVEAGLASEGQRDLAGSGIDRMYAGATGTYVGAGLGAQILFDRWFLLADARWRRLSLGAWEVGDPPSPAQVPNPDRSPTGVVLGIAAGYRY